MESSRQSHTNSARSAPQRDLTSPRRDNEHRISKPSQNVKATLVEKAERFLSQDEQSRRFIADEDKFVLKQSKKKADIRVREGRGTAVDLLCFNLRWIDADREIFDDSHRDLEIPIEQPEQLIKMLTQGTLQTLEKDIASYVTLEVNQMNKEYWQALDVLCKDRLISLRPQSEEDRNVGSVASEVDMILEPKTLQQLEALEKQVQTKLQTDEDIDADYWEQLLKRLYVWKAKARLQKILKAVKSARSDALGKVEPGKDSAAPPGISDSAIQTNIAAVGSVTATSGSGLPSWATTPESAATAPGTERFLTGQQDFTQATKALYEREVARGIGENEEIFTAEEAMPAATKPQWAGKYRPRKPQYFNRVQMGYEWNKYNQTHYDHDNPPPKVVQGYKFNIFYPDLIDKTKAPTFKISREGGRRRGESTAAAGEMDTCLIRFIAGPPYEDVAFRIVDKEWDYSAKRDRGFKSSFDKGILQLHFQFQKIFYRK